VTGPPDPAGTPLTGRSTRRCTPLSAPRARFPPFPPAGTQAPLYEAYRASADYVSADGRVVLRDVGLATGDPDTTGAMNAWGPLTKNSFT
jgi:hypothetical protein